MNQSAQNAMLKQLEEGPPYAAFLLLTENAAALLPTVRSRCELLALSPVSLSEAEAWLIDEAYVIPFCMDGGGYVASYLNPFESQYAPFGVSENRYKYQWIYETPMGMDEYETALAEWEAERDARLAAQAQ